MRAVAIMQPNYLPWRGYFSLISQADTFVWLDNVQYTKNDWRNRNQIFTRSGKQWLTIPVQTKGLKTLIKDVKVADKRWNIKHWKAIRQNYSKARFYPENKDFFEELFRNSNYEFLLDICCLFVSEISSHLGLDSNFMFASEIESSEEKNERLLDICSELNASQYISPPASKAYIDESLFRDRGIELSFLDYSKLEVYPNFHSHKDIYLSVIDLIFNIGPNSKDYLLNR